ncbi:MAG: hypothetical protein ACK4RZ_16335 [Paracoccaceae bacterium]
MELATIMTKRIFNRSFAELDALAKKAVSHAVSELHAKGIPTYHMEGGQMIETAPNGAKTRIAAVERADASLIYDNSGAAPNLVLQLEKTKIVEQAEKVPHWVDVALVQPLQQRAAELKKLKSFANANDLTLQKADATGQVYEGRMQVQTEHFITQNIGHRTLVVHDKAFVGKDLQPGQALRVDYSQYKPSGNTPLITHMGPAKGKDLGR